MADVSTETYGGLSLEGRSRIGWGAIFAGAFVAFAVFTVLNALGIAVGLSAGRGLGGGTAAWAIIVSIASLFLGGWVSARTSVRETRMDAVVDGTIMWGILFFALALVGLLGIRIGLSAILGVANATALAIPPDIINRAVAGLNLSQAQIAALQGNINTALTQAANVGAEAAWWSWVGMIVSLGASIWGAYLGVHGVGETTAPRVGFHREVPVR